LNLVSFFAQRFGDAVLALIVDGPVKQRLANAYAKHLADLTEADLPANLRAEFADLQAAMSKVAPVGSETPVRASVQKMSADEATSHAATIVKLYVEHLRNVERAERSRRHAKHRDS
jgi:hypothetical protein